MAWFRLSIVKFSIRIVTCFLFNIYTLLIKMANETDGVPVNNPSRVEKKYQRGTPIGLKVNCDCRNRYVLETQD